MRRMEATRPPARPTTPDRKARARQLVVIALTVLATLFAVLNLDKVSVNWIVGTWRTPLIVVIAVSMLVGAGAGFLAARRTSGRPAKPR
jgi:uncharacterized integral membrane protein